MTTPQPTYHIRSTCARCELAGGRYARAGESGGDKVDRAPKNGRFHDTRRPRRAETLSAPARRSPASGITVRQSSCGWTRLTHRPGAVARGFRAVWVPGGTSPDVCGRLAARERSGRRPRLRAERKETSMADTGHRRSAIWRTPSTGRGARPKRCGMTADDVFEGVLAGAHRGTLDDRHGPARETRGGGSGSVRGHPGRRFWPLFSERLISHMGVLRRDAVG